MNNQDPNDLSTALNNFAGQFMGAIQNMVQNTVKSMMSPQAPPKTDEMGDVPDIDSDVTADANTQNAIDSDNVASVKSDGCLTQTDANGAPEGDASSDDSYTDDDVVLAPDEVSSDDIDAALDMLDTARTIAPGMKTDSKQPKKSLVFALKKNGYTDQALKNKSSDYLRGLATHIKTQRMQAKKQIPKIKSRPQNIQNGVSNNFVTDSAAYGGVHQGMCSEEFSLAQLRNDRATKMAEMRHNQLLSAKNGVR